MRSTLPVRAAISVVSAVILVVSAGPPAMAAPGDLDPGFGGGDGQVVTKFDGAGSNVQALAVQGDGKILAGGSVNLSDTNQAWALVRYKPGGQVDQSFGDNGRVVTDFTAGVDVMEGLVVLGNGKIVGAGYTTTMFAAVRYTPDGHLDHAFSGDGKVLVNFGPNFDGAYDVASSPGGKVVLAGEKDTAGGSDASFALARLTSTGALDDTFDGDGKVATPFAGGGAYGEDLLVHKDGSVLMTGDLYSSDPTEVAIAAYRPNGTLDPDFGDQGTKTIEVAGSLQPRGMIELPSGKIVIAGSVSPPSYDVGVLRLKPGGDPDQTFGPGGLVTQDFGTTEYVQDLRGAGTKLVLAITLDVAGQTDDRMAVVRLVANGAPDTGFGDQGVAATTFEGAFGQALAVQKNGRILLGGVAPAPSQGAMAVARFLAA